MDPTSFDDGATKPFLPLLHTNTTTISQSPPSPETMFSPTNDHVHILDPVTSTDDDGFDSWELLNFGTNTTQASQNYDYYRGWNNGGIQFRPDHHQEMGANHQSGVSSQPLWQNSPPGSPFHPWHHHHSNYQMMSPTSRAEAIARGQWELMEMVKTMPESCYELSLKDLVEQPRVVLESQEECLIKDKEQDYSGSQQTVVQQAINHQVRERVKKQDSSKKNTNEMKTGKMARSGSMDNRGLFLKMVFPISLGLKKKKNSGSVSKTLAKVSPKPDGSEKSTKSVDKDWWKKRSLGSRESDSSNTGSNISGSSDGSSRSSRSNSNASTSATRRRGLLTSCWSSFNFKKSKSAE